jgi:hypothetical protein
MSKLPFWGISHFSLTAVVIFKVCPEYFSNTTYAISMKLYRIDFKHTFHRFFNSMISGP